MVFYSKFEGNPVSATIIVQEKVSSAKSTVINKQDSNVPKVLSAAEELMLFVWRTPVSLNFRIFTFVHFRIFTLLPIIWRTATIRGTLWWTLMSSRGRSASHNIVTVPITVPITVPKCTIYIVNCAYGHQPPITLYLHAKLQLQICCTSLDKNKYERYYGSGRWLFAYWLYYRPTVSLACV